MDIDYLLIILPIIVCLGLLGLVLFIWQYRGDRVLKNSADEKKDLDNVNTDEKLVTDEVPESTKKSDRLEPILHTLETEDIPMEQEASPRLKTPENNVDTLSQATTQATHSCATEMLFVFHLLAHPERPYTGYELLQSISSAGFHYGAMNIFHYHLENDKNKPRLFSLAQSVEPGIFDLDHVAEMQCPGLCLFMSINPSEQTIERFELLLETAQTLLQDLGGTLCDQQRRPLTSQQLQTYRAQFLSYA